MSLSMFFIIFLIFSSILFVGWEKSCKFAVSNLVRSGSLRVRLRLFLLEIKCFYFKPFGTVNNTNDMV